nr:hypothetical protein [Candidatus Woesearchaeota archaeon]
MTIQEKNNYCVCAVLQRIFLEHKIIKSQNEIAKNLTPAKNGFRVDDNKIKNFIKSEGFDYDFYWWNETPFNEPESILEDMKKNQNHGLVGIKDHLHLFYDFKYPQIQLIDPSDSQIKTRDYYQMIKEMRNTEGFFALIRKIN